MASLKDTQTTEMLLVPGSSCGECLAWRCHAVAVASGSKTSVPDSQTNQRPKLFPVGRGAGLARQSTATARRPV